MDTLANCGPDGARIRQIPLSDSLLSHCTVRNRFPKMTVADPNGSRKSFGRPLWRWAATISPPASSDQLHTVLRMGRPIGPLRPDTGSLYKRLRRVLPFDNAHHPHLGGCLSTKLFIVASLAHHELARLDILLRWLAWLICLVPIHLENNHLLRKIDSALHTNMESQYVWVTEPSSSEASSSRGIPVSFSNQGFGSLNAYDWKCGDCEKFLASCYCPGYGCQINYCGTCWQTRNAHIQRRKGHDQLVPRAPIGIL